MQSFSSASLSYENAFAFVFVDRRKNNPSPCVAWCNNDYPLWKSYDKSRFMSLSYTSPRTSKLCYDTYSVSMPEHLSAVLLLWPHFSFKVNILNNGEMPVLDGSALPLFKAIMKEAGHPGSISFYEVKESFSLQFTGGSAFVTPSDTFEVEYTMERGLYKDDLVYSVYSAEDILPLLFSRTFIFEEDYENALKNGLLRGVTSNCGLLLKRLGGYSVKVLNDTQLRYSQEPMLHKVLDLVGDLTLLAPSLPKVKIRIHNGGHAAHRKIFERLVQYVPSRYTPEVL